MVKSATGTSTSASATIDGATAQGTTKHLLRAFPKAEMLRHQSVNLGPDRFAGSSVERELGQGSIPQCRRREWESGNHPCIEPKESARCRCRSAWLQLGSTWNSARRPAREPAGR